MIENEWTKQMADIKGKIRELKVHNIALFVENEQLKTANTQAEEIIIQLRKERNYWHEMATKGGGNG
uniref:Uncharacterized protein n=2 Tax=viral metagenome TaxID=1070528 RepID=A0A6M3LQV9_9ZZZZ